ncbi:MAG: flavodoxin [Clostridia bacterium]|nr:flavodoxin [Lachnospiraceae bacterium]NCC01146.1 flavodoxin [Clostridia bacterium]NCD03044.1 flavodoxin [Clostridia bacterium]
MSKKILVAYFSASGETEQVAEELAKVLNCDIHEIEPEALYTTEDLNWNNKKSRSSIEMQNPMSRPSIVKMKLEVSAYDEILIGFPIWWNLAPTIINTFIENYDFAGKTLRTFATSGGSGIGNSEKNLQKQYPQMKWQPGKLLNNNQSILQFADMIR